MPDLVENLAKTVSGPRHSGGFFDHFCANPMVHDFEVGFQFGQYPHIYRGLGKSKIPTVFWTIPYRDPSEIGGLDGVFRQENLVLGGMCHPGVSKTRFLTIFSDLLAKPVQN